MAMQLGRLEAADQPAERDLALVFVAMIAGHQEDARSRAIAAPIADLGDRDRDPAIGRAVHRMRQAQKAGLLAVAVEIDLRRKTAFHGGHARLLAGPLS